MSDTFYTLGHSTHSLDNFIQLLNRNDITAIADVRSNPYSNYTPQFNMEKIQKELLGKNFRYVFLGDELGGKLHPHTSSITPSDYYENLTTNDKFISGIERLFKGVDRYKIAIMCTEKDPLMCHRFVLISRFLESRNVTIMHIFDDGNLENQKDTVMRMLKEHNLANSDLFLNKDDLIHKAYQLRWDKINSFENDGNAADIWEDR